MKFSVLEDPDLKEGDAQVNDVDPFFLSKRICVNEFGQSRRGVWFLDKLVWKILCRTVTIPNAQAEWQEKRIDYETAFERTRASSGAVTTLFSAVKSARKIFRFFV